MPSLAVRLQAPAVGRGLQDHAGILLSYPALSKDPARRPITMREAQAAGVILRYLLFGSGPLTFSGFSQLVFGKSQPQLPNPDYQLHIAPGTIRVGPDDWEYPDHEFTWNSTDPQDESGLSVLLCNLHARSRGSVQIRSADALEAPEIRTNFLADVADEEPLLAGWRLMRNMTSQLAQVGLLGDEVFSKPLARVLPPASEAYMREYMRRYRRSVYHGVGTCACGSVLDSDLKFKGISRLRVVDASAHPSLPSGNTHVPILAVAERVADILRIDHKLSSR